MKTKHHHNFIDLTGQVFTRLTPEKVVGRSKAGSVLWKCRCKCNGKTCIVSSAHLQSKHTKSCGCLQKEKAAKHAAENGKTSRTHGHTVHGNISATYKSYRAMLQRCTDPNHDSYLQYGGARPPIKVCKRWKNSKKVFINFVTDQGPRPNGTTNGRFGDTGDYKPSNCSWMTRKQQEKEKKKKRELLNAA